MPARPKFRPLDLDDALTAKLLAMGLQPTLTHSHDHGYKQRINRYRQSGSDLTRRTPRTRR